MESEKLKVFDEHRKHIGEATRAEVHRLGLWHEAFHCWFIGREAGIDYIYLQKRSHQKTEYPDLLDITAAGHLLANETVVDGVREIKEEIGIDVAFDELIPLGIVTYSVNSETIIDNEFVHVFLYETKHSFDDFVLQEDEVSGMIRVPFFEFYELWLGDRERVSVDGFRLLDGGTRVSIVGEAAKERFVEYVPAYFETVLGAIKNRLNKH